MNRLLAIESPKRPVAIRVASTHSVFPTPAAPAILRCSAWPGNARSGLRVKSPVIVSWLLTMARLRPGCSFDNASSLADTTRCGGSVCRRRPDELPNIAKRVTFSKGDTAAGFRQADVVIERRYTTKPVHQAYIEPHACVVSTMPDGQVQIWASSQGQFMIRAYCAKLLGIDIASIRVMPAEIGGGFGGKTLIYLEPVALVLTRKTGRPVKIVMTREEVFRATGPTSGGVIEVKLGAKRDGTIT